MIKETSLCMGCMNDKTYDGPCKLCGYSDNTPCIPTYMAPKTFLADRYIVGKVISYNGEGAVYIGYDTAAGIKVTIKEFMPDTLCSRKKGETDITVDPSSSALYKTYMSEFIDLNRTLMKLRGMPHVQTVLDVFCENNTAYVVFEYINGISLKTYLANSSGEIAWEQVKELFSPFFTTLSLIHSAGIIHRGISPSTIFVTDKLELTLGGFAICAARTTGTEIPCEMFAGFAAPEQYTNEINGTWTDVYGISAVLYRCLTGCTPTEAIARSGGSLMEPMMINRNVPANISRVIMEGLSLSPDKRIRTITELVDRLFTQPKPAEPAPGEKQRLSRKEQKQRRERAKTIAVLVIAGIVLAAFVVVFVMTLNGAFSGNSGNSSQPETAEVTAEVTEEAPETTAPEPETTQPQPEPPSGDTILMPDFSERSYSYESERYGTTFTFVPTYEYSDTYANGMMYDQSIEPGTEVTAGVTVVIKVSKGPSRVALPDFTGKDPLEYTAELGKLNIKYSIKTERSNDAENGMVCRCSVEIGDLVDVENGQEVVVFCAENYEPTAEPTAEEEPTFEGIPVTEEYITEETAEE
ncbi:MAG: PASTA domain-containing protein [Oscillospiraceae bacterium]